MHLTVKSNELALDSNDHVIYLREKKRDRERQRQMERERESLVKPCKRFPEPKFIQLIKFWRN